jgi:rhamnosyltransferase
MHSKDQALPFDRQMAAVVVTYHPDAAVLENVRLLTEQVGKVIVVDNASAGASAGTVSALEKMPGVWLIRNAANLGIAAAMNTGIRHALADGYPWIATFDQDSTVPNQYFEELLGACASCPAAEWVSLCPASGRLWAQASGAARGPSVSSRQLPTPAA